MAKVTSKPKATPWYNTVAGKAGAIVVTALIVAAAVYEVIQYTRGDTPGDPNVSMYVDSQTGQAFPHRNAVGDVVPILSPYTNQLTGYPGVPCFWTKSGDLKTEPTWLILNSALGKPEPTFCPDCGRLVRPRQPAPKPGDKPPPTREELLHNIHAP
jgi:hypothetical protein